MAMAMARGLLRRRGMMRLRSSNAERIALRSSQKSPPGRRGRRRRRRRIRNHFQLVGSPWWPRCCGEMSAAVEPLEYIYSLSK